LLVSDDRLMTSGAGGHAPLDYAVAREVTGEGAAAPFDALDFELSAMPMQCVFDDSQAQP
jgi:hypothetical protein